MRWPLILTMILAACGDGEAPGAGDAAADAASPPPVDAALAPDDATATIVDAATGNADLASAPRDLALVAARPYNFKVPVGYDKNKPTPLVILLHGYSASGVTQNLYFGLSTIVDARGFLYAYPDGTVDKAGQHFWNATDACCDLYGAKPDDVAYLNAIIDDVTAKYNVDAKRVYVIGHSNGGFMSHRFACDVAPRVAAIMALAGDNWKDASRCVPSQPVSVLQVHGTADLAIAYGGGLNAGQAAYPSAHDSVATWAARNGCAGALTATGQTLDLDGLLLGSETKVEAYGGCPAGGAVELWTIQGGGHVPSFRSIWADTIVDWLYAHARP